MRKLQQAEEHITLLGLVSSHW